MSRAGTRRTFLVGLGRFMVGATAASIIKPPVLYSFPSEIRIASPAEQNWIIHAELVPNLGAQRIGTSAAYNITFQWKEKT